MIYVHEGTAKFHIDQEYFNSKAGDIILIRPNALHSIHPIENQKHYMDALNFQLDLMGYSAMDQASIDYLQPLYKGELDLTHVIKPNDTAYAEIRQCLLAAMETGYFRKSHYEFQLKAQLNQLFYLLFENGYVISKDLSPEGYRKEEKIVTEKALELLDVFGLKEEANFKASNLPYGKQRKLEIARALGTNPKLLLLDEPAAGMNPAETAELMETIALVRNKFGISILLIEHDMSLVMGICERLVVLEYGRVIADGLPDEVVHNPRVVSAYLGE